MADLENQGWTASCVRHTHPVVDGRLRDCFTALASGPVWVRPRQGPHDEGRIEQRLSMLGSGGPVFVTDLWEPPDRGPRKAAGPQDRWLAYQTSGSTGSSKCVVYRENVLATHADRVVRAVGIAPTHRYLALPSPRFAYGLSIVFSHARCGVPVLFTDADAAVTQLPEMAGDDGLPLALYLLPQQVPLVLRTGLDSGRLERVIIAGGRLSRASAQALARRFPQARLTNMYGQAELGPRLSLWHGDPRAFVEGTIGRPIDGVSLVLADEERGRSEPVPLLARSEHAMWRCLRLPYDVVDDGPAPSSYVNTGDLAIRVEGGELRHCGRADHELNVAGTKIDVRRVSALLEEQFQPLVARVSAAPSRVTGDVLPMVELVPGPDRPIASRDVRRTLHADYGNLASLFQVRIVEALDVGESGK